MNQLVTSQEHELKRVHCISLRMGHHAGPSGYDRITEGLGSEVINTPVRLSLPERAIARLLKSYVQKSGVQWYTRNSLCTELRAAARMFGQQGQLFHFLYGENSYRYLGHVKRYSKRKNWLAATFHTPIWRLCELVGDFSHLRLLDAAIVVSTNQLEFFADILGDRVFYVPHGIDTDFFCTDGGECNQTGGEQTQEETQTRFVMVGSHLRDFDLALRIVEKMAREHPLVEFDLVARKDDLQRFKKFPNVKLHTGISDIELRELYRRATALMLPLTDCTANNALLEGMACGLPIISSDLVGVRDYVDIESAFLMSSSEDEWISVLKDFCAQRINIKEVGAASRLQAERFAWPEIAAKQREVYRQIAAQ